MTEAAPTPTQPMSLFSRAIGMITSPKATFEKVVAVPRPVGILLLVVVVMALASALPQFTAAGQQAILDMQMRAMEARGPVSPQAAEGFQRFAPYLPYVTIVSSFIFIPIVCLFVTALYWGFFNVVLGGTATFKQVLATVTHAQVIPAIGLVAALPFMMVKPIMTMGGPFSLGALMPMLEQGSRLATFLSNLSLFNIWGVFVNAIGLAVLYRKKTTGIFIVLLIIHLGFIYLMSMFRGN